MSEAQEAGQIMVAFLEGGYIPKTFWTQNAKMGHAKPEINFLYVTDFHGNAHTLGEFPTLEQANVVCSIIRRSTVIWLFDTLDKRQKATMAIHSLIREGM